MSMKVERSTVDQIKQRFEFNKKRKEEEKKKYGVWRTRFVHC
jgi:U4/U6.U5 tri-snRNP component SNU23